MVHLSRHRRPEVLAIAVVGIEAGVVGNECQVIHHVIFRKLGGDLREISLGQLRPFGQTTARKIAFSSWRILPGQS